MGDEHSAQLEAHATKTKNGQQKANSKKEEEKKEGERPFDLIIFAASSSVGQFVVEEMALVAEKYYSPSPMEAVESTTGDHLQPASNTLINRRASVPKQVASGGLKWAVAGRSAVSLSETLNRAELATGIADLSQRVPIVLADLQHEKSLWAMCKRTRLLINCAGPYWQWGEPVIQAAISCATHYVDLAHESSFVEAMRRKYTQEAQRARVLILNGCGFQSMAAEMGLNFVKQVADGQIEEIKILLSLSDTKALARRPDGGDPGGGGGGDASTARWHHSSFSLSSTISNSCGIVSPGMWRSLLDEKQAAANHQQQSTGGANLQPTGGLSAVASNLSTAAMDEECGQQRQQQQANVSKYRLQRKDTQTLVNELAPFKRQESLFSRLQLLVGSLLGLLGLRGNRHRQRAHGYCWPIDSLTSDQAQLMRGEMLNYELREPDVNSAIGWRPIQSASFITLKSLTDTCLLFLWMLIFNLFASLSIGRALMRRYPSLPSWWNVHARSAALESASNRSADGRLTRDSLSHIKFCQTFIAYGTPNEHSGDPLGQYHGAGGKRRQAQLLVARVVGPEPNHITTATLVIQAALALILESEHLPASGGFLTPGAAFSETNIIYQLRRRNIKFEVLKKA